MRRAVELAREANDDLLETRLFACLLEALLLWGIEQLAAKVPNLRRAALHTADPYSILAWHGPVGSNPGQETLLVQAAASVDHPPRSKAVRA